MKENKKAILEILKKKSKKDGKTATASNFTMMPCTQPTRSASFTA